MAQERTIDTEDDLYGLVLGTVLAQHRERARLAQKEVALRVGASPAIVSRWEQGLAIPRQHHIRKYADAVGSTQSRMVEDAERAMQRASHVYALVRAPSATSAKTPWWSEAVAAFGMIGLVGVVLVATGEVVQGGSGN